MTCANDDALSQGQGAWAAVEQTPAVARKGKGVGARASSLRRIHVLSAAAVLLIGVALSLTLSQSAREEIRQAAQARFDTAASNAAVQVERRFAAYAEVLTGLRALFHTGEISREAFRRYTEALDLEHDFPGFQCLNYAPYVAAASKEAFEESVRLDPSLPEHVRFAIYPPGARDGYYPITLTEPMARNEQYLGRDIAASAATRATLELARDTGRLSASGKLIQVSGPQGRIGLAMRMPVYRVGMPADTVERRRAAYLGSVGAGFLVTEMLAKLPGVAEGHRVRLFDGGPEPAADEAGAAPQTRADKLLFDTFDLGGRRPSVDKTQQHEQAASDGLRRIQSFALGGRLWVVESSAPLGQGVGPMERMLPSIILVSGIVISALLAGVLLSLLGSRRRAVALARDMTLSLRTSQRRLAEAQGLAKVGSWVLDLHSGTIELSDEARRIYGLPGVEATPALTEVLALVPQPMRSRLREAVEQVQHVDTPAELEHAVHTPDGSDRWVHVNLQRSTEHGATTVCVTVRDETARRKSALRLELAHNIAQVLAAEAEPESAVRTVLSSIGAQLGWHAAVCWAVADNGRVSCLHAWAQADDADSHGFVAAMRRWGAHRGGSDLDAAWVTGDPLWRVIPESSASSERDRIARHCGLNAALVVPVIAGAKPAALEFFSRTPIGVDREIEGFMRSVASQLAQYLQRKQAESALRHVANHDALTGLDSRTVLHDRLAQAIRRAARQQSQVAVLFLDIDRFKHINDSLGHSAGDVLLRAFAQRLRECVRKSDTLARFGGDEFVLVLEDMGSAADVLAPLGQLLHRLSEPFDVNGRELPTTSSVGVSMYPEDGQDVETLLMNADAAMYRAKESGRGTCHFYSAQMNAQDQVRLALETSLHRALEREELFLVYQPKLDLRTARITGVEALMRWRHPTLGMVSPAQFIPIAEDTGLIDSLGHWALQVACRDARKWQDQGHPVQVSVNLSARQLDRPRLVQEVVDVLAAAQLDPGQLELEITESGVMQNAARAAAKLQELRSLGVSLAIDDFGTGYSSLSYLQRFPLCTVKIDRSFIKDLPNDPDAAALTAGIIGLAQRLRMKVVAEGVETLEQLGYLRTNHCDEIQGYFLSRPISADEMSRFLACDVRHLLSPVAA